LAAGQRYGGYQSFTPEVEVVEGSGRHSALNPVAE
jgi:hypothetical protein